MNTSRLESTQWVVKICGLRDAAAATVAAQAGADLLGFLMADSRRKVSPEIIADVRSELEAREFGQPLLVAVTVNSTAQEIAGIVERGKPDLVQLSGDETPELLDEIDVPLIKTLHVGAGVTLDGLRARADLWLDRPRPVWALHIDAKVTDQFGGTGERADWTLAALLADSYPVILAGGLKPGNVAEGISMVRPSGVDVSSGVEIGGVKDHALIESFVVRSKQAFLSLAS